MRSVSSDTNTILLIVPWVIIALLVGNNIYNKPSCQTPTISRTHFSNDQLKNDDEILRGLNEWCGKNPIVTPSDNTCSSYQETIKQLQEDKRALEFKVAGLEGNITTLKSQIVRLKEINTILTANLSIKEQQIQAKDKQIVNLRAQNTIERPSQAQLESCNKAKDECLTQKFSLGIILKECNDKAQKLQTQRESASKSLTKAIGEINSTIATISTSDNNGGIDWTPIKKSLGQFQVDLQSTSSPSFNNFLTKLFNSFSQSCNQATKVQQLKNQQLQQSKQRLIKQNKQMLKEFENCNKDLLNCQRRRK